MSRTRKKTLTVLVFKLSPLADVQNPCPGHKSRNILNFLLKLYLNPSHAAIKISINATAAGIICKNIFPTPVQVKKIIKNKIGDIQQMYLHQNVCK